MGKRSLSGLKVAVGPELWWGANPAFLAKYQRRAGPFQVTGIFQEDLAEQLSVASSFAVPLPPTRKATLHLAATRGAVGIDAGGIWSGSTKVGQAFQIADGSRVLGDEVKAADAFGGKAKVTVTQGRWNWYAQAAAMGLVADGGPTQTLTFTGWHLKDSGSGNQWNFLTGLAINAGSWQVAPNFLWQKPLVGPVPAGLDAPARPRNVVDDPFAVRGGNRETTAGELLITYDPTPATWMYNWDSDIREDAPFAASVGFVYRSFATTQDAGIGILADGRTIFAFPGAPAPRDLWELRARLVSKRPGGGGFVANLYTGTAEPNGSDERLVRRLGGDIRIISGSMKYQGFLRFNDWGPYDYHRDYNHTFPVQVMGDASYVLGLPGWFDLPQTRFGVRATWRSLNRYSPRFCPVRVSDGLGGVECNPTAGVAGGDTTGSEWEIRTYLHIGM